MRRALLALVLLASAAVSRGAALALPAADDFGYLAASAPLAWNDISGSGSPVTAWSGTSDDGYVLLNIPFNFRFYGAPYNKISISSNGYLQFGTQSSFYGTNCLSANQDPRAIAALYWMDLNPGLGGAVYTQVQGAPGSRIAVIQFQAVPPNVGGGSVTAQFLLAEADHSLTAQYLSTASSGSGVNAVAGLRSNFDCPNRTSLPLSCLQAVIPDGLAVRYSYPLAEPDCGTPTHTPTSSISPTFSASPTITPTFSASPSYTDTPSVSATPSITLTPTPSPSGTASQTGSPSATISPSPSDSPTPSPSPTETPSYSASPTATASPSPTHTPVVLTDAFGYHALFAPPAWEDISGTGAPVTAWAGTADDGAILLDLPVGFNFRYYGSDYNKVAVSSNGYLQFGSTSSAFGYTCLNTASTPTSIAALFWMDLNPGAGGSVLWEVRGSSPSRRLIVQFQAVPNQAATGTLTAQAVLFEGSNALSLRYLSSSTLAAGANAAAGLRSLFDCPNRTGLSLSCSQPLLGDGVTVDISYPALEPACGTPTNTPSPTPSASPSATPSATATDSPTSSASPSATPSATETATPSISPTFSVSPTATPTASITPTFSASPTFSHSPTITETSTISPTFSASPTATESSTISPTFSVSPTFTVSPTITETFTVSPSFSVSPTVTETATESPSSTITASTSPSPTLSPSFTASPTPTASPSATPSATRTSTPTASPTATPSGTRTVTGTGTPTSSFTVSPTPTNTLFPPAAKPACLVLGQSGYLSSGSGPASAGTLLLPGGVALDTRSTPYKVYVSDSGNHRVLYWADAAGLSSGQPADGVIGQASFSGSAVNQNGTFVPAADTLYSPAGLAVDPNNGDLWVADSGNHRVLRFAYPIPVSGAVATRVLGQGGSFITADPNKGGVSAASLQGPKGLSFDAFGVLAVADTGNHRVLRFSAPLSGASADVVWGQAAFGASSPNRGGSTDATGLSSPAGVQFNAGELWVADTGQNRVLHFSTAPVLTGTADLVLGQLSFSGSSANQGWPFTNDGRLSAPTGLGMDGAGRLMVADAGNHRVVAFEPPFDAYADQFWGQPSLGFGNPGTGQDLMTQPLGLAAAGAAMVVADSGNQRLLFYGCGAGLQVATATATPTGTPTRTPSFTMSPTITYTPTLSPSFSPSPSFTYSDTRTLTSTRTPTPTITLTSTISNTYTRTPTPSVTHTLTPAPTQTWTLTPVPTVTPYPSVSDRVIAWPNPAALSSGRICLAFPADPAAKLHIYDRLAQPVAVLSAQSAPGLACWDLRNDQGDGVAPGQYYVRVLSAGQVYTGKLTLR